MKAIIFGATGMVGQGVLRECLLDPAIESVLAIGRSVTGRRDPKLREIAHRDMFDFSAIANELSGFDACFFCLGVAAPGMTETDYTRITFDIPMAAAQTLAQINPTMAFLFVSAHGADSAERARMMWMRVKGKTENALLRLPFRAVHVFRPGAIQPLHGIQSRTRFYRGFYKVMAPAMPMLTRRFPKYVTTTERIGRAMIRVAREGFPRPVLENLDINVAGER